ncbi:MAG: hypothetical protein KDA44_14275 [Planctomycetales bacterium]|nr:hypothetical protein [Planctomycetales bacterium]
MKRHALHVAVAALLIGGAAKRQAWAEIILPPPGGAVVTWTDGAANNDWHDAGNWNLHVPQNGDAVIINSGNHNVWLTDDSAEIRSLYVSSGIALYNFYHKLQVRNDANAATTTVTGNGTGLVVSDIGGSQQDFNTDYLAINNGAYLRLDGGKAHADRDVDTTGAVEIRGHGILEVGGGGANALSFSGDSELRPHDGNLRIDMTGGGTVYFGGAFIDVTDDNSDLIVEGAHASAMSDTLQIGAGNTVDFDHPWEVSGLLKFMTGGGEIVGAAGEVSGELRVNGSIPNATIEGNLHLTATSEANVHSYSTLELGRVTADAGHTSTLNYGATLRMNIPQAGPQSVAWNGHIDANGSNIEVNSSGNGQVGLFNLNGSMNVGSWQGGFGDLGVTDLQGTAAFSQNGTMNVTGNGGRVLADGGMRFTSGSTTTFAAGANLEVQSMVRVDDGAGFSGAGDLVVAASGQMFAEDNAVVDVDVVNHGNVRVGTPFDNSAHLNLADNYTQSSTGTLSIDLAGTFASQYDRLIVDDLASLDGTLDVTLAGGFMPSLGDDFLVLTTSGGLSGAFANAMLPSLADGLAWFMDYSPFALTLSVVEAPSADVNGDGHVNGGDFLAMQRQFGQPGPASADVTGDGVVTGADFDVWQSQYGTGPPPAVAAMGAVPEPAAATIAGLLVLGCAACLRRNGTR